MKSKSLSAAFFITLSVFHSAALFADDKINQNKRETFASGKGAALFSSGAIAGAALGGPIGAVIGAMGGALIGEDLQKGARDANSLDNSERQLAEFKLALQEQEAKIADMEQAKAQHLEFQVMFTTGSETVKHRDTQRLISLANYLKRNPELKVRIEGYADPRGTDESNNLLSKNRAKAVLKAIESEGISQERISYTAHGEALSTAKAGDNEAYALERRVNIEVFNEEATTVAVH